MIEASRLSPLFGGLSRLYEVAEHGTHYYSVKDEGDVITGGDTGEPLPWLLENDWSLFSERVGSERREELLEEVWPDYSRGVLYATEALWYRRPDDQWETIKDHLKHERRFFLDRRSCDFSTLPDLLRQFRKRFRRELLQKHWVRARIQSHRGECISAEKMGPPPCERATPGRANPAGIAYWYLASDANTACAEVRAEPGHRVTVADVELVGDITVLDLAEELGPLDPFAHEDLPGEIEARALLRCFAADLSRPVLAEDQQIDYVPTQYLAEYFATRRFDGIRFRSSIAEGGVNLVLFDRDKARVTAVRSVQVLTKTLRIADPARF